jgi:phosphatidylserine decarboxylase
MRVAKEGLPFILSSLALAAVLLTFGWWPAAVLLLLFAAAFTFFFRDPERVPPAGDHLLVSPADGEVLGVETVPGHPDLTGPATKVTIFLSLLDVHLVRAPLAATVARAEYRAGKFLQAARPEAGELNESRTLVLRGGPADVVLKMSVGVAARRIKAFVEPGDAVSRGQRIGLMYFGSRVELTLPTTVTVRVGPHDKVKGGLTVLGEVRS